MRRGQQLLHQLLVSVRRLVVHETPPTSSGFGGSPVRSSDTRRASVRRSASGFGFNPFSRSFARTKASMGLLNFDFLRFDTSGTVGRSGLMNAQCPCHGAPGQNPFL